MDMGTALEVDLSFDPAAEAKIVALKNLQKLKTKRLMGSIDVLQKEVTRLKVLGKDSRRAQMVQALRNKMREYDFVVDFLKAKLEEPYELIISKLHKVGQVVKVGGLPREEINELIIRKTTGGPKRFRPLTREELENQIVEYKRHTKADSGKIDKASQRVHMMEDQGRADEERQLKEAGLSGTAPGKGLRRSGSSGDAKRELYLGRIGTNAGRDEESAAEIAQLSEEVKQLTLKVDVKDHTLATFRDEVTRLRARNAELMATAEKVTQKERKQGDLESLYEDACRKLEESTTSLAQAREEALLVKEAADADFENVVSELKALHEQCQQLLKQNTVLLQQLGQKEMDGAMGPGAFGAGDGVDKELQATVDDLRIKLKSKSSEAMDYRVQAEKMRVEMRDKNEQIRELKRTMAEMKRLKN